MPTNEARSAEMVQQVPLPDRLVSRVEARLPYSEFNTADEWIVYALEEVLARVEESSHDIESTVTEQEVESRLESLGYLDR